jgi:hypothetical protein
MWVLPGEKQGANKPKMGLKVKKDLRNQAFLLTSADCSSNL